MSTRVSSAVSLDSVSSFRSSPSGSGGDSCKLPGSDTGAGAPRRSTKRVSWQAFRPLADHNGVDPAAEAEGAAVAPGNPHTAGGVKRTLSSEAITKVPEQQQPAGTSVSNSCISLPPMPQPLLALPQSSPAAVAQLEVETPLPGGAPKLDPAGPESAGGQSIEDGSSDLRADGHHSAPVR
jgi:hypothetical protein